MSIAHLPASQYIFRESLTQYVEGVWVRDLGHRAALLRVVCFALVPGSSLPFMPPHPHPTHSTPRSLPFPLSPSPSLAGPYAQNLRLISFSAGRSVLRICLCDSVRDSKGL